MSRVRAHVSTSLDGYVAGPTQSTDQPLGEGGEALHAWVVELATWRGQHGMDGGVVTASTQVLEEETADVGAEIMGRGKFGPPGGEPQVRLEQVRVVDAPGVVHVRYRVVR